MSTNAGFQEIDHTADWALEVWAPDLAGICAQAAQGMFALSGMVLHPTPRVMHTLTLTGYDPEHLLVRFLSELLFLSEEENLGFDRFEVTVTELTLTAQMQGALIQSQQKEIKAVTYHELKILSTLDRGGVKTVIVFDV